MGHVIYQLGNIFEAPADLTVLPCSVRGTVSSTTARWLQLLRIPDPNVLKLRFRLGDVSDPVAITTPGHMSRSVVFAATVMSGPSNPEAIEKIGNTLGTITTCNPHIRLIESPLLGTGAGALSADIAGRAIHRGFKATAHPEAMLYVFVPDQERLTTLQAIAREARKSWSWDAVNLRPGAFGFSVDLKKLLPRLWKRKTR